MSENSKSKLNTVFIDEFSEEVYNQTYRFGDETIDDTHLRVAKELAKVEINVDFWTEKFLYALRNFSFVPGGRILSNAGTGLKGTTYINCFVDGFIGEDQDSMEGIMAALKRQALILKSEGGYGFCADVIRPKGAYIRGIANETPGVVKMLEMWDTQSSVITAGSGKKSDRKDAKQKIRKGAQMVTLSCWNSDIEEFITAKQTQGRLTKFNMSVLITDEFMRAVDNNDNWDLIFPDYENASEEYKKLWDGNIDKWKRLNLPIKVYKTIKARKLWDLIMTSTYNRNEPGVLFVDTINRLNNLKYIEYINSTNPCAEQPLPIGAVCLLGSLNLTQFINDDYTDWNYSKLSEIIPIAVRMMDNVNDITYVPLKIQEETLQQKRRLGLGIMGYGSALMMMKIKYGSEHAIDLTHKLMSFIANTAYCASSDLAAEKGSFPQFDAEKYLQSNYLKVLNKKTIDKIKANGLRNSHLLTIAPTGNSSMLANIVSGGLEPLFMPTYVRTSIFPYPPVGLSIPVNVDFVNKTFTLNDSQNVSNWEWIKEGDENMLASNFGGYIWKYDKNRGLLRETVVKDYAVRKLEENGSWNPNAEWATTTTNLSINEHVCVMEVFAKYIDSSLSKTVNIPADYSYDDFKNVYKKAYDTKIIKGITTYRAGTMSSVLSAESTNSSNTNEIKITKTKAPKRPKELDCDINTLMVNGQCWIVIVGLIGNDPYEIFAFPKSGIQINNKFKKGKLIRVKRGVYNLDINDGDIILENITSLFGSNEQEALTRMVSTALRHGADIGFIVEQLQKSEGSIICFAKSVARTLKTYINEDSVVKHREQDCESCGGKGTKVMQEGCYVCSQCGYSKCS